MRETDDCERRFLRVMVLFLYFSEFLKYSVCGVGFVGLEGETNRTFIGDFSQIN